MQVVARGRWPRAVLLGWTLLTLTMTRSAFAQGSDNKALAEELFRQGQTLMQEQRYAEACPKLAESQRLDPGTGTLLNLGVCHEREGKLASAWAEFNEVITLAQRDGRHDRVSYARERIAAVEPRLSRLKIELPRDNDMAALEVKLDGNVVGRPALGVAVPVDPGTHEVAVSAPGKVPWRTSVVVEPGPSTVAVAIPALLDAPKIAQPAPFSPTPAPATHDRAPESNDGTTQRIAAYALGGLGVIGVGLGAVFGVDAIGKNDDSYEQGCIGNNCSPEAGALRKDAQTSGTISTIAFIAGGAALAGGAVLFFTAPSARSESTRAPVARMRLAPGAAAVEIGAVW